MAGIEGVRIRNFGVLKNIAMGSHNYLGSGEPMTAMTAIIGENGVGKSTLLGAFGFMVDCLRNGVEEACDSNGRGGFRRLKTKGARGPIEFSIRYREEDDVRAFDYDLSIDLDRKTDTPYVSEEVLSGSLLPQGPGRPYTFLYRTRDSCWALRGEEAGIVVEEGESFDKASSHKEREYFELADVSRLAITTVGSLTQHPRINRMRKFLEGWYLSYFAPDAARSLPLSGPQKQLTSRGDNLGNVVQHMEKKFPAKFRSVLKRIGEKIPGIDSIETEKTMDGRVLLKFNNGKFKDPFYSQQMSDGTLKVFAYYLLLENPDPPPLLCIEEPENGVYHKLIYSMATEFRRYAEENDNTQLIITTHQPFLIDALDPRDVWIMSKGNDGCSRIQRASDNRKVTSLVAEGLPMSGLWYGGYLDERS